MNTQESKTETVSAPETRAHTPKEIAQEHFKDHKPEVHGKFLLTHRSNESWSQIRLEELANQYDQCCQSREAITAQRDELLAALKDLFANCAMVHSQWGENSNQIGADAAIEQAKAAIANAESQTRQGEKESDQHAEALEDMERGEREE